MNAARRCYHPGQRSLLSREASLMRTTIAATILILGLATGIAHADPYRWCAEGSNGCGTTSCYFKTLEQCRAAAAGNGGQCTLNPFYTGSDDAGPRVAKKKR
jgi:uncharacterized protein DUF3551